MRHGRRVLFVLTAVAFVATLAYLRDPPWLGRLEEGFRGWEMDDQGTRFRWIGGHASFFVPSDAASVTIPIRTTFEPGDWPIAVSITIDDRPADRLELSDGTWHHSRLKLPPPDGRRVRRIDIRANRTRSGNRSVQVGEHEIRRSGGAVRGIHPDLLISVTWL